jgi:hypothetical protein
MFAGATRQQFALTMSKPTDAATWGALNDERAPNPRHLRAPRRAFRPSATAWFASTRAR